MFQHLLAACIAWQSGQSPSPSDVTARAYYFFIEGRVLEGQGDVAGAVKAYRSALEIAPSAGEIRAELASLYARQNRVAEAVAEAEAALKIDTANRLAHRILGSSAAMPSPTPGTPLTRSSRSHRPLEDTLGRRPTRSRDGAGRALCTGPLEKGIATCHFLQNQPGYPEGLSAPEAY